MATTPWTILTVGSMKENDIIVGVVNGDDREVVVLGQTE